MATPSSSKVTTEWVLYEVWIIMEWIRIPNNFMIVPVTAQKLPWYTISYLFLLSWPLMTTQRSTEAIFILFSNKVTFISILISIHQICDQTRWFYYFLFLIIIDGKLWWPLQGQIRSDADGFHIRIDWSWYEYESL